MNPFRKWRRKAQRISSQDSLRDVLSLLLLCILCAAIAAVALHRSKACWKTIRHAAAFGQAWDAMAGAPYPVAAMSVFPVFNGNSCGEPLCFLSEDAHDPTRLRQNSSPVSDAVDGDYRRNDATLAGLSLAMRSCSRTEVGSMASRCGLAPSEFIALPDRVSLRVRCRGARWLVALLLSP